MPTNTKLPSNVILTPDGNTSFLRAARAGHLDKVLEHLRNNVDINTSNSNGLNALHLASKDGHVTVVTELLKRGASVDSATKKGNTALHIASLAGQEEVVKLLVEHGASVNVQSQNGFTPLYMAAQENHDNVVKYLLSNGANQSLATEDGFTPLAVAMQQGHDKVVTVLLENDTRGKVRLPALHIAAKKDDCKAAALLLQNEHNPDVTSKSGFTPLHIASHYGNEGIAKLLLNKGADVNYSAKHNITPLHVAAKWGKSNMVSLLLEQGANIESRTRDGLTPLHCAARSGHEQVVDMLLERSAPISSKTKNGLAPLHMSSQGDHVDAARILLYHRAPVDEVTVDYLTALHVAAHCGHARVAKLLLDRKADPNARALNGFTPLHIACKKNRIKVVELLLKHGASIEATTESGLTPLHVASFMGCMNIVIYLLQNEANPDVPTVRGETPLHLAARANQTDIIRILLRNGAQVDARAREQQTPLHIAARLGNVDIVMLLLQHGASVDCTTKDLYSALHIAAKEGQDEVAAVLLENGASPTATTKKGFTPLHLAAKYGNMKVARLLLQRDAPVDAQGKNGVTPLHVASHYDHQNVALLLLEKGASPHATAKNGHSSLHIAAKKNQMDIATTLLEYGAKASAESKAGFTPLHLSAQEGHMDMSSLLIDHHANTNHKAKNGLTPLHLCAQEDRVNVASVLVKNGAEINTTTKAGYTPLHVACHFGQLPMVKFLLEEGGDVAAATAVGYTPLHQAAQQGHCAIVNSLLAHGAPPNHTTIQGQTPMSIAQKLGYISVVETLKGVTEVATITPTGTDEKYKVVSPETMQETFMSDSEDEGGEDTLLSEQPYRYLTVDEMKSLGDDSLPIDVRQDERLDSNRECMTVPPTAVDDTVSPQHLKESYSQFTTPDNVDITKHPLHIGFLVSFLVDARGGAMRGCRHSGVRVIVPPRRASMPVRVTCRYLKRDKLSHPPPLMEGEALASRILELGPVGAKFLGPVMIEVPHFGSLRGKEREIVILRSDNGETWREHTVDCSEEAVQDVLSHSFDKEDISQLEDNGRTTRILTTDFPHYFAVVTRVRQEVHAIGPEGGMVSSSVVPQVQAVFPQGALTKKIKVGLQAQPISAELAAKLLGNRVAVSPIVTVEPRRRKFHKPITLTIPKPQAANKGMINQYSGDAPTLRLLCSITGGTTRAQWEDVTGSTPFTFVNDCVSFTTTVSARFWLMDCRNVVDATKMATELYREAIHVPFMAKFVVFAKRVDPLEARLRIFCMTDDKEDKTLEHQEHFTEVAKSRDVEVLEGKTQYVEFAGNLVPVTKSGEQLQLGFRAFRENRLPFTVRVKDPHADCVGRTLFMREARLPKGEPPQQPICVLNLVLPEEIIPETILLEHELHKYSFIQDSSGLESYQRVDLRVTDISNLLGDDWPRLAEQLDIDPSQINRIKDESPHSVAQQGLAMLKLWLSQAGNKAQASTLETGLSRIGRDDIVQQCVFNIDQSQNLLLKEESLDASIRRNVPYSRQEIISKDSESIESLSRLPKLIKTDGFVDKDDKEERKYEAEEKEVEEVKKSVSERRKEIEKRLSLEKPDTIQSKTVLDTAEDLSEKEIAEEKSVSSPEEEPSELSFQQKRLSFEQGKRVIEMKPDTTTMKEVKERVDERLLLEERRLADAQTEKSFIDETSIPFQEKVKSFEQGSKAEKSKDKYDALKKEELRRDSALFEGVSQGLIHLDAAFTAAPQVQDLLSPKASKTPPPSPAELKSITGTVAWTDDSTVLPRRLDQSNNWAGEGQTDSTIDSSPQRLVRDDTKKEDFHTQLKYKHDISVTSATPKITETIVIKTTENKILKEKEEKYQFTMSADNKQIFKDILSSTIDFLETEKYYNSQPNKETFSFPTINEADITSSNKTENLSQTKPENEPKSDKSFVGKMSKKLFGVFKRGDKDISGNDKQTKSHKKNSNADDDLTTFNESKQVDNNKDLILSNSDQTPSNEASYSEHPATLTGVKQKCTPPPVYESTEAHVVDTSQTIDQYDQSTIDKSAFPESKSETLLKDAHMPTLLKDRLDHPVSLGKSVYTNKVAINEDLKIIKNITNDLKEEVGSVSVNREAIDDNNILNKKITENVEDAMILSSKSLEETSFELNGKEDRINAIEQSTTSTVKQDIPPATITNVSVVKEMTMLPNVFEKETKVKSKSFLAGVFGKSKIDDKANIIETVPVKLHSEQTKELNNSDGNSTNDIIRNYDTDPKPLLTLSPTETKSEHKNATYLYSDTSDKNVPSDIKVSSQFEAKPEIKSNKEKETSFFGSVFRKADTLADDGKLTGEDPQIVVSKTSGHDISNIIDESESVISASTTQKINERYWDITKEPKENATPVFDNKINNLLDMGSNVIKENHLIENQLVQSPEVKISKQQMVETIESDFDKSLASISESIKLEENRCPKQQIVETIKTDLDKSLAYISENANQIPIRFESIKLEGKQEHIDHAAQMHTVCPNKLPHSKYIEPAITTEQNLDDSEQEKCQILFDKFIEGSELTMQSLQNEFNKDNSNNKRICINITEHDKDTKPSYMLLDTEQNIVKLGDTHSIVDKQINIPATTDVVSENLEADCFELINALPKSESTLEIKNKLDGSDKHCGLDETMKLYKILDCTILSENVTTFNEPNKSMLTTLGTPDTISLQTNGFLNVNPVITDSLNDTGNTITSTTNKIESKFDNGTLIDDENNTTTPQKPDQSCTNVFQNFDIGQEEMFSQFGHLTTLESKPDHNFSTSTPETKENTETIATYSDNVSETSGNLFDIAVTDDEIKEVLMPRCQEGQIKNDFNNILKISTISSELKDHTSINSEKTTKISSPDIKTEKDVTEAVDFKNTTEPVKKNLDEDEIDNKIDNKLNNETYSKEHEHSFNILPTSEHLNSLKSNNDDKLTNILIDMLIEQECIKSQQADYPSNKLGEPNKLAYEASTTLSEKYDTEYSEKHNQGLISPPYFKSVASFGEIEAIINEEPLKRVSDNNLEGQSSYVTTPTMQRRRIGGSQRLSREERPALREVLFTENYSSSDEDETGYIVTEPCERTNQKTVTFQVDSDDETSLKVSDYSSEVEVTEMTPSPDPTSKNQAHVNIDDTALPGENKSHKKPNSENNSTKIERRFERMASETLSEDTEVKFKTDREFQRMVSQLSNEEVDACLNQWEEEGLTPSEDFDSTKDTVEGDLDSEVEALPEASFGPTNPFYRSRQPADPLKNKEANLSNSVLLNFYSTPTNAIVRPNEFEIPDETIRVQGEPTVEDFKKSTTLPTSREREESLLELTAELQDKKEAGPSTSK